MADHRETYFFSKVMRGHLGDFHGCTGSLYDEPAQACSEARMSPLSKALTPWALKPQSPGGNRPSQSYNKGGCLSTGVPKGVEGRKLYVSSHIQLFVVTD